jgi:hypothetical protein
MFERFVSANPAEGEILRVPEFGFELSAKTLHEIGRLQPLPGEHEPGLQIRGGTRYSQFWINESEAFAIAVDVGDARPLFLSATPIQLAGVPAPRSPSEPRIHVFYRVLRVGDVLEEHEASSLFATLTHAGRTRLRTAAMEPPYEPYPLRAAGRLLLEADAVLALALALGLLLLCAPLRGGIGLAFASLLFLLAFGLDARLDHAATRAALDSPDPATRGRAAGRLADFAAFAGPAAEALEARFAIEADPEVRAAIAIAAADPETIVGTLEPARRVVVAARADRDERVREVVAGAED